LFGVFGDESFLAVGYLRVWAKLYYLVCLLYFLSYTFCFCICLLVGRMRFRVILTCLIVRLVNEVVMDSVSVWVGVWLQH